MPTILHISFGTELFGTERSLLLLIQGLSRKGYRSVVAGRSPGPLSERIEALNVPVVYTSIKPWLTDAKVPDLKRFFYNLYHLPFLLRSAVALREVIRRYEVDLVHTSTSIVFDGALAAALAHVPHVWHIRENIEPGKSRRFFLGDKVARRLIKSFSHRIIVNSEAVGKAYLDTAGNAGKVRVVYNGVALDLYDDDVPAPALRQKLGIPSTARLVGMVAQMEPRKRHEDFLKAAAIVQQSVPDSFFLAVGGDLNGSEYGQAVGKLLQESGLTKRLVWLGHYDKIHEVFKAIDLLVLPSEEEPFGRVVIEAMAARKPVVATAVGGIPEIVVDGVTGFLVPPRSPADLASSITRILGDPQLAEAMGQAGRRRVEQHFTAERYVDNIEAIYQELLSSSALKKG